MVNSGKSSLIRASAASSNTAQNGVVSRSTSMAPKPSNALLPTGTHRPSLPLILRMRRLWKKWNYKDASGRRSRLSSMIAAFKLGIYFKIFITVLIMGRILSHSAQMAFPTTAITSDAHFSTLRAARTSPTLRLIVVTESGESDSLQVLLDSLSAADYGGASVALDVWMYASSLCDALPLPLYPLAVVLFGPPRFDHSIDRIVSKFPWPHGSRALIAARSEPDWASTWTPAQGTANETIVFIDASRAKAVSPMYYQWLQTAKARMATGMQANVAVYALDAVSLPQPPPIAESAILTEAFLPATSVFSPTRDTWTTFLDWHARQTRHWFARPKLPKRAHIVGFDWLESLRVHPLRAWFSQFLLVFEERVCHPLLPRSSALVFRKMEHSGEKSAGALDGIHLTSPTSAKELFAESVTALVVPEQPSVVKWDGSITTYDEAFGMAALSTDRTHSMRVVARDVIDAKSEGRYVETLRIIADFSRARGGTFVSIALVTRATVDAMQSWLCNVVTMEITPGALVLVTADDGVQRELQGFLRRFPRLSKAAKVVSLGGAIAEDQGADGVGVEMHGSPAYWRMMVQRTILLRDLLNYGVSLLHFEPEQVWLSDPVPAIRHAIGFGELSQYGQMVAGASGEPEMIVSRSAKGDVVGNFVYMRPSASTRHLWSEIAYRFYTSYQQSVEKQGSKLTRWLRGVQSDQSLLTAIVLGRDAGYRGRMPGVRYANLNRDLFVDGTWFMDWMDNEGRAVKERTHYRTESSRQPVVLNNNELDGSKEREKRARRFGMWFLQKNGLCDVEAVRRLERGVYLERKQ